MRHNRGSQLVELVFATAIFLSFVAGSVVLISRYTKAQIRVQSLQRLDYIAEESFEVLHIIARDDFSSLLSGVHGLSLTNDQWVVTASADTYHDGVTRTVEIEDVYRDIQCTLEGESEYDPDMKLVTVTLDWTVDGKELSRSYRGYVGNLYDGVTPCTPAGDGGYFHVDWSAAETESGGKSLVGVVLRNQGDYQITVDKLIVTWTGGGNIRWIKIGLSNLWHGENGTGSPQGIQPSGTVLDIVDLVMEPKTDYIINDYRFDTNLDGQTFTVGAILSDGSTTTSIEFVANE